MPVQVPRLVPPFWTEISAQVPVQVPVPPYRTSETSSVLDSLPVLSIYLFMNLKYTFKVPVPVPVPVVQPRTPAASHSR